jgi:hypothetical protein
MQIGIGKSGVKIGEYGTPTEGMGTLGWIEPACKNPQWILWFDTKGDAILYTKREPGGAVIGEPIKLKASSRDKNIEALKRSLPKITLKNDQ